MGIEEVRVEILDTAKNQAKLAIKEAEKEKKEIMDSAESRIKSIKERIESETAKTIEQYKAMVIAETSSMSRKKRLSLEKELIDEVFNDAAGRLSSVSQKKRELHVIKILAKAGKQFPVKTVYCSKKDIAFVKKYKAAEENILGGAIVENESGDVRVDMSYETILSDLRQEKGSEISKKLFS